MLLDINDIGVTVCVTVCHIKINILLAHNASSVHYIRDICQISIISQSDGARRRQIYNSIKIHYLAFQLQSAHFEYINFGKENLKCS